MVLPIKLCLTSEHLLGVLWANKDRTSLATVSGNLSQSLKSLDSNCFLDVARKAAEITRPV